MKKRDKKGIEIAFSTVIVIILAILILTSLLFIFYKTSNKFKDTIDTYFFSSNVDSVIENCNNLALMNSQYEYCCVEKTIKLSRGDVRVLTCLKASNETFGSSINKINCDITC